jgi:hypothetical protein
MDYPRGERAITHHAGPVRIGGRRPKLINHNLFLPISHRNFSPYAFERADNVLSLRFVTYNIWT